MVREAARPGRKPPGFLPAEAPEGPRRRAIAAGFNRGLQTPGEVPLKDQEVCQVHVPPLADRRPDRRPRSAGGWHRVPSRWFCGGSPPTR